jgi:hypothetical protein
VIISGYLAMRSVSVVFPTLLSLQYNRINNKRMRSVGNLPENVLIFISDEYNLLVTILRQWRETETKNPSGWFWPGKSGNEIINFIQKSKIKMENCILFFQELIRCCFHIKQISYCFHTFISNISYLALSWKLRWSNFRI